MKVEIGENNCLFIFLDAAEAKELQVHRLAAHYASADSRAVMDRLYRDAAQQANFSPVQYRSRVIELLPFRDGSVLLCFRFLRALPPLKVTARRRLNYALYHFESAPAFAAFLSRAEGLQQLPEAVYESAGAYRILISRSAAQLEALLGEYAEKCTEAFAPARTREYWRTVYAKEPSEEAS